VSAVEGDTLPRITRIGHKGADSIRPGNTLESFEAAVAAGVEMIELDVLRPRADFRDGGDWRRAAAGPAAAPGGPLLIAHDWGDATRREPLTLDEALDAFTRPSLDGVEIDCDLKIAGREGEVTAALRERGLLQRARVSTMEVSSLGELRRLEPELRLGWTVPRITRDWSTIWWAKPLVIGGLVSLRARLPRIVLRRAPELGLRSIWAYHPVITARLARACHAADLELIAWTVDDIERMRALSRLGVDGICTNDPRLFAHLEGVG
jgi:glycerophosphoryl diester phosphodiesterase